MSLQELVGPVIHLKLSIREGHGFGFLKRPIVIVAGTNGIFLETEVLPPSPDPLFHVDLVWETDKKNLRRFRASNTPIKLECFTVGPNSQRESIGSILLNIKSAQVIAGGLQVNEKWQRLIGVPPEAKALQPELLLSLTIQEPNSLSQPLTLNSWESNKETVEHITSTGNHNTRTVNRMPKPLHLPYSSSIPSPDFKQGYIQLGPENSCMDTFTLVFNVNKTFEMELLLQNCQDLNTNGSNIKPFQVTFAIMGQSLATKPFGEKTINKISQVNEEVALPLRTSLSVLHLYLQENPSATVSVLYCGQEVAAAEVHIRSLVPTNDVQSFSREFGGESVFTQNCILVSSNSGSSPIQNGIQPTIEVMMKLVLTAAHHTSSSNKIPAALNHTKPETDNKSQLHGSGQVVDDQSSRSESRHSQDTFVVTSQSGPVWVPVAPTSEPSTSKTLAEKNSSTAEGLKKSFNPNAPTVNITLNSVRFYCLPNTPRVRFVFESPNSSITTSAYSDLHITQAQEPIIVEDMCANILSKSLSSIHIHVFEIGPHSNASQHFASATISADDVSPTTKEGRSVSLVLKGSASEQNVGIIHATLVVENFSNVSVTKFGHCGNFTEIIPSSVAATWEQSQTKPSFHRRELLNEMAPKTSSVDDRLSIMDPVLRLAPVVLNTRNELHGAATSLSQSNNSTQASLQHTTIFPSQPAVTSSLAFDSKTAEKIVEELEDWKERQQEIFIAELKKKEEEHIARITEEWTNQTKAQNTELDHKMAECKALADSLSNAKQDLRDRLKTCAMKEQALRKAQSELDHQYNVKFQELTLAAQKLDEGFKLKVSSFELKFSKLQERLKELESENESLHQQLRQKPSTYTPYGDGQMCGLSHGQVSQLLAQVDQLEGKLHASLQSKAYFKEQWGRAVREMNQAKIQFAQSAENKNSLGNLLGKEEEELQNDQRTLEKLRSDLAKFKSNS